MRPSTSLTEDLRARSSLIDRATRTLVDAMKTYEVRTYGCQMNVHDSERLSGLLESAGYVDIAGVPDPPETADVVVFNTCAVRENADNKLYGNLGQLRPAKIKNPAMQIAVGGCLAQKDRVTIVDRAPWVDVVFGTHNMGSLPALLDRARHNKQAEVEILESLDVFPSTLPTRRDSAYSAFVSISVGCNNTCTFCIVPILRGREMDRSTGDILAEIEEMVPAGRSPASSGSASPARTRRLSPTTSLSRWRRRPTSCPAFTCRCSRARTGYSRRCVGPTAARRTSAFWTPFASTYPVSYTHLTL